MTSPLEALEYLSRQDPTHEYFSRFQAEVNAERNERGAAILLAANTELCLRYSIQRHLITVEDGERMLFSPRGELRTFGAKIQFAFLKGLYETTTKQNLDCIRGIRNAFAHAVIPISFETSQVKTVCDIMTMPEILAPRAIDQSGTPRGTLSESPTARERFQKICEAVAHNLFVLDRMRMPLP
jgi:hypothetical protein